MLNRSIGLAFLALALSMSAWTAGPAAAGGGDTLTGPAAIPQECYCAECGMKVGAGSLFASQIIRGGKAVFFCDLGDMMLNYASLDDKEAAVVYVMDFTEGSWINGKEAFYLSGAKVRTPMRYGILAFGSREKARKFMDYSGGEAVYTLDEAVASGIFK